MASKFQSRLIGTVILVAIGVIVLPDVFDGKKEHYQEEFAAIPIKPTDEISEAPNEEIKAPVELDVPLPEEPVATVTVQSEVEQNTETVQSEQEQVAQPEAEEVAKVEPEEPKVSEPKTAPAATREKNDYADSAWIIQLAALKNRENAQKIVTDLQQRGFQAHLKQDGTINRVIVGPDVSKEKLEQQVEQLQKITGLKGQIRTFKPLN